MAPIMHLVMTCDSDTCFVVRSSFFPSRDNTPLSVCRNSESDACMMYPAGPNILRAWAGCDSNPIRRSIIV